MQTSLTSAKASLATRGAMARRAAVPRAQARRPQAAAGWKQQRGGARDARARVAAEPSAFDPSSFSMAEAGYDDSDEMSAADIKAALLDSLFGTERGLAARSEVRAEINELITQLEAKNPTPSPNEMLSALNGEWKLVYTSNSELLAILALSKLPFVTIGDITQNIDVAGSTVENRVAISVPLSRTSVSTTAAFEVRSPKRLAIRFERGAIATPQLLSDISIPDSVSVLGQTVDLTAVRGLLQPVEASLSGLIGTVGSFISRQPDLSFPLPGASGSGGGSETWLITTYLDQDTRITRGDGGSVFILVKEVSIATPSAIIEPPTSSAAATPTTGSDETPAGFV